MVEEGGDLLQLDLLVHERLADPAGEDESRPAAFSLLVVLHMRGKPLAGFVQPQGCEGGWQRHGAKVLPYSGSVLRGTEAAAHREIEGEYTAQRYSLAVEQSARITSLRLQRVTEGVAKI